MYPSPNNCYNPFDDDDHHHHQNPSNSKSSDHHPDPPFHLPFPPTFFDDRQMSISPLNQILLQAQTPAPQQNKSDEKPSIQRRPQRSQLGPIPRRRVGKKDRHSKICTAQGIRDRRMRLSLQIARKFFGLQDALGYDKASKTIEWLFAKSKKAIRELVKAHPHYHDDVSNSCSGAKSEPFVVSDCEVVSGMLIDGDVKESCVIRPSPRSESRERARCPTRERMMVKELENTSVDHGVEKLGFLNSPMFKGVDQGSNLDNNNNNNNQENVSLYGNLYDSQHGDVGTIEKFLGNSTKSIVSCPNYYSHVSGYMDPSNGFMGFLGNWDMFDGTKRTNSVPYGVANDQVSSAENLPYDQVSSGENPSSIYSATS